MCRFWKPGIETVVGRRPPLAAVRVQFNLVHRPADDGVGAIASKAESDPVVGASVIR